MRFTKEVDQFMLFLELKNINNRNDKNANVVHEASTTAKLFLIGSIVPPPPPQFYCFTTTFLLFHHHNNYCGGGGGGETIEM